MSLLQVVANVRKATVKIAWVPVCLLVGFTAGVIVGIWYLPDEETHTATVEAVKSGTNDTRSELGTRTLEEDAARNLHVDERIEKFSDGHTVTTRKTRDRGKTVTKAAEVKVVTQTKTEYVDRVHTEVKDRLVLRRPDWILGATAGRPVLDPFGRPVFGLSLDRRIIGGVYAGVNANTDGLVGVGVKVVF